jgi:hypothetical protein
VEEDFSTLQTFSWLFTINNRTWCNQGLTLSDLHKSLFEGTVEEIMWGSPSIPITHPELFLSCVVFIDVHNY